jgi:RsmE family RNA methyltransferase
VKEITLLNAWRVEKSYWQTPILEEENLRHHLVLGLEQARDTILPRVDQKRLFKPFVEDELAGLTAGRRALVAHPVAKQACPEPTSEPTLLAIGPEGGWLPYEVEKLVEAGCSPFHLGPRILRTEVALPTLVAHLTGTS